MPFHTLLRRSKSIGTYSSICRSYSNLRKQAHILKDEDLSKVRNIGIIAHIDAGKTTTTERMLYYSGFTRHLGDVDDGDTVMDYMEQERDRGITIASAAITFHWKKHKINLIDTPGHVDFTIEVERALRVLDGAVTILDASAGVEAQTMTVWRQADKHHLPSIIYLNKLDKVGVNINECLNSISTKLRMEPYLINFPFGNQDRNFTGLVNVIDMKKYIWDLTQSPDGNVVIAEPIEKSDNEELWKKAMNGRSSLIGRLSDLDEKVAEEVLLNNCISQINPSILTNALRKATMDKKLVPVFCGSSLKNKGVQLLMDAINSYLPSPKDKNFDFAQFYGSDICALAFKTIHDKQKKPLTFFRIYSGHLKSGTEIYNVNRNAKEKISRLYQVYANEFHDITSGLAGNIVCAAGLKETITGDTVTSSPSSARKAKAAMHIYQKEKESEGTFTGQNSIIKEEEIGHEEATDEDIEEEEFNQYITRDEAVLAGLNIPSPVFFCSIEPPSLAAQKDLDLALECLQREDPSLRVEVNKDTEQTILSGMGELHLEIIRQRILKEFKVDAYMGPLQIAYKETISSAVSVQEELDNVIGGQKQHVVIGLTVHQKENNTDFKHVHVDHTLETSLHNSFKFKRYHLPAVENGIKAGLSYGPLLSFPVIDVDVSLYHFEVEHGTTQASIAACASMCMHKALKEANMVLLEPMMSLEINVLTDRTSAVLNDLAKRRSRIVGETRTQETAVIHAVTPLSELRGYSSEVRKLTSGNASFSMELSHYEKMYPEDQKKAIESVTGFAPS